jgi:diketogulonate reductase-like aldo/keto reductase
VEDNLRNLKLDSLHLVNLRVGGLFALIEGSIAEPLSALESMQREGLVRHIGLSNVSPKQYGEEIAIIVCVQNHYNVANRKTTPSSTSLRPRVRLMPHSFRWEGLSRLCNRQHWMTPQPLLVRRPLRSLRRGYYSARRISC